MTAKPCKVCNYSRLRYFGVAVDSLSQLKLKGSEMLGFRPDSAVSVVLEDDGTFVEDEAYFLCLPSNTKFMLLCTNEVWTPAKRFDGGTAWLRSETDMMETDGVDQRTDNGVETWRVVADKLKQNLANVILLSEADLQEWLSHLNKNGTIIVEHNSLNWHNIFHLSLLTRRDQIGNTFISCLLGVVSIWATKNNAMNGVGSTIVPETFEKDRITLVDVPHEDLCLALGYTAQKTLDLQDTLQRVLDRREEERQSKELLQLYLKAVEKEQGQVLQQMGGKELDKVDGDEMESTTGFCSRTLLVLKGRTSPETRLSNTELQMVVKEDVKVLMESLGWDRERTISLVQACERELNKRLQQVQALQSLSTHSQQSTEGTQAKRRK